MSTRSEALAWSLATTAMTHIAIQEQSMAKTLNGWKRSPTSNTTANKESIMNKKITAILALIFISMFTFAAISEAQTMKSKA